MAWESAKGEMQTAMTTSELKVAIDSLRYDISKLNTWNVKSPNDIEYYDEVLAQLSWRLERGIWTNNGFLRTNRSLYFYKSNGGIEMLKFNSRWRKLAKDIKPKKKKEPESWNAADFIFHVDK